MSEYPFKSEKYRQYQNTFLQRVTIGFDFPTTTVESSDLNTQFNDYLQSFFGVTAGDDLNSGTFNVTRKDMNQSFDFSNRYAVISLNGSSYVGFSDTAIPQIFKLRNFFNKVVKVEKLTKAGIRKLNVFNIKANGNTPVDAEPVMKALLSSDLLAALSTENLSEEERSIPGMHKCVFSYGESAITIRVVMMPPSKANDSFHHLLLDTLGELTPAEGIRIDDVADCLMDFNKVLYDCYHWCVSDSVKQVMQQEENNSGRK